MKRFAFCILGFCAASALSGSAHAGHFALKPISASGTHSIQPARCDGGGSHGQLCGENADCPSGVCTNEIRLTGGGQTMRIELRLSDWAPELLRSWQARLDSTTYANGVGGDLTPAMLACTTSQFCAMTYEFGSRCLANNCSAGFINSQRLDWVHISSEGQGVGVSKDVSVSSPNYLYFAVTDTDFPTTDPGTDAYGGGLVLFAPSNAAGTYLIRFNPNPVETFMADPDNIKFPTTLGALRVVMVCTSNANCNDNNDCTTDVCSGGTCSNTPNYDTNLFCCDPSTGDLAALNNNSCTNNTCNSNGTVNFQNKPALTACGSTANSQCDKPDSCDGNGNCNPRFEPSSTLCGDMSPATTCNPADTCNGAGACNTPNLAPANTPCGNVSPLDPECDLGDTCNGLGACLVNNKPDNTPCHDGDFCTDDDMGERCLAGGCVPGAQKTCADLLTCTTNVCDEDANACDNTGLEPNTCLIEGVCYNHDVRNPDNDCQICDSSDPNVWTVLPDGTDCNDGNACTGTPSVAPDTCAGPSGTGTTGVCAGEVDPNCNDTCDVAVEAVVGQNFSDNSSTGPDDGEASCEVDSNADVWWEYTALCDGAVFVSTTDSALLPINDTVLSVYDDCPSEGGTEIGCPSACACDDDSGAGLNAALIFPTTTGTRYLIRVAGYGANVGPVVLNLKPIGDCLIAGVCYEEGDLNPENDCQACIPDLSSTQWSNRLEGSTCEWDGPGGLDGTAETDCDNPDACDGAGECENNFKPDGIACSDDGPPHNECTRNLCAGGLCTHPPESAGLACDFPGEGEPDCDNPDTCDGGGLCAENLEPPLFPCGDTSETQCDNPDICDGLGVCLENLKPDGTSCDDEDVCTGTDICTTGDCAGTSILEAPIVEAISSRHLRVTPQPPGSPAPVALYVTSPDYPCLSQYVDLNGALVGFNDRVIQLNDDWGTITVQDPDIVPSTTYEVRAECGNFLSAPGVEDTYLWGDVDGNGMVNIVDVSYVVDRVKGLPIPFPDEATDLYPCIPDTKINVLDISNTVDALKGFPYPCGLPCHD